MRKEIFGILLFFLVILTLISLLSYSPADPSIHNARTTSQIHNLFGLFGAHMSGLFIGFFGLGAFWIPILLLLISIHFFGNHPNRAIILTLTGGFLLIITTGSLLAIKQNHIIIFGSKFSSGGIIGIPLKSFLVKYSNASGGVIILTLTWIIGLIMATGFSLLRFIKRCWQAAVYSKDLISKLWVRLRERRQKIKKRPKVRKDPIVKKKSKIEIKPKKPKPVKETPTPKQEVFDFMRSAAGFQLPSVNLLDDIKDELSPADDENLRMQSKLVEKKLEDFGVMGRVVTVSPGPVITTFEYEPAPGVKINKIVSLTDDLPLHFEQQV